MYDITQKVNKLAPLETQVILELSSWLAQIRPTFISPPTLQTYTYTIEIICLEPNTGVLNIE